MISDVTQNTTPLTDTVAPVPGAGRPQNSPHILPSPLRTLLGVQMLSTGGYVPPRVVTNAELAASLGFDSDWISQRTGIQNRRICDPDIATSDIAAAAGFECLARAKCPVEEVDLLIVATSTPDVGAVATGCIVQDKMGLNAPAFDLFVACAGFMYALITASQFVASGCARRALVIGADCMSRVLDPKDQRTFPLFGDGAGAVLLGPGTPQQGLLSYTLGSDGSGAEMLIRRMGGSKYPPSHELIDQGEHYLKMDGKAVFKWAVRLFNDMVPRVLQHGGLTINDIDLWIVHQANQRIIEAAAENLGIPMDRIVLNLDRYGNTTAGSVPLVLDEAVTSGRVRPGGHIVLSGFGAGLSWGTAIWQC